MIKAVIIDDEKNAIEVLEMQLHQFCKEVSVIATCNGGKEGVKAIKELQPDLVFLDIEMPHINGFEVLDQTKNLNYKVIFTTAYDQFAIKAFKFSAIDYLLKPIDFVDLQNAVEKAQKETQNHNLEDKIKLLVEQYYPQKNRQKVALPVGNMLEFFDVDEIIRVESDSNYSHIFLANQKKITLSKTLKDVEENIKGEPFFRVHQSHLINTNHVEKAVKGENAYVVMKDGTTITVSRNRKEEFFELFRRI
ncbi:LytTR family DNA-binding domain-containing protein [Flavobacterium sp.]|uniref:LytR/AlgR family response regulator transcription factor n=1 Tax=Flavobacterium sp. TaxID=239 RepID=UPI00260425F7|nr:LytTR family DNA-binding domain-containing protein [Flavobacterium sp.]